MVQNSEIRELLEDNPVVAAVKSDSGLQKCLGSNCQVVFLLFGNICNIGTLVQQIKSAGKIAIVHIDLVEGLAPKDISVRFIRENTLADGIISTKPQLIKTAKELGFFAVQRFFILDSLSVDNVKKQLQTLNANIIELLPAINTKIVKEIAGHCHVPLIVGGIIIEKEDIFRMLSAGAIAVSTSREELWQA